jgi:hypothetical protein
MVGAKNFRKKGLEAEEFFLATLSNKLEPL